jgi:hypothetical protein
MSIERIEKTAHEEVSAASLQAHVEYLAAIGEKLAGNIEEVKACHYIMAQLASAGVEARVLECDGYVSHPGPVSVATWFPEKRAIEAVGLSFAVSTPPDGISAEIVAVGDGAEKHYAGRDVAGKIVLVNTKAKPDNACVAAQHGAAALIGMSDSHAAHKLTTSPVWGVPGLKDKDKIPRIAVASINRPDGDALLKLAQAGKVMGTVKAEMWEGWKVLHIPVAEIPGANPQFILVGGHYCSWWDGATDNATGNSCLIELARILKKREKSLRYGVRIAWWPGHSNGRYAGSTWYADAFWQDIYDNGIAYLNIDSPGVRGASIYKFRHQMAEIAEFNEKLVAEFTSSIVTRESASRLGKYVSPTRSFRGADQSFNNIGLSSIGVYSMLPDDHPDRGTVEGSAGAWWWHTKYDTIEKADARVLAKDTQIYLSIVLRLAMARVLPFDFAATAQDYLDALRGYEEQAGRYLPLAGLADNLKLLKEKAAVLRETNKNLQEPETTERVNRFYVRLARTLNPPLYAANEPCEYERALPVPLLPDLEQALRLKNIDPDADDFKFLATELKRRINKINLHVLTAVRMIDCFMESGTFV